MFSQILSYFFNVWAFNVLHHGLFVRPMLFGVCDMPSRWELIVWMTTWCSPFVPKLHREKIANHCTTKESRDLPLVIHTHHLHSLSTPLIHCPGGTRNNFNTSLIPVQDQFWGDFFHCYCGDNIGQELSFHLTEICCRLLTLGSGSLSLNKVHPL